MIKGLVYLSRSISRILYILNLFQDPLNQERNILIIYLSALLPIHFSCLPSNRRTCRPLPIAWDVGIHGIAPHRVYMVSLQHDLYILSVALVLASRLVVISHYAALWCSDFPPNPRERIQR